MLKKTWFYVVVGLFVVCLATYLISPLRFALDDNNDVVVILYPD